MTRVDVVVVGGGPAGSSCARRLVAAGLEVVVVDQARFPRNKVCAGWITPGVVRQLDLDLADYAKGRVLEPLTAFRVRLLGQRPVHVDYGRAVSYGIRRDEFDHYLLARTGARLAAPTRVQRLERTAGRWMVNGDWSARFLVGAGGHGCPVARLLNPSAAHETVVVAQRVELAGGVAGLTPGTVELFFEPDLHGYGWIVPKGPGANVGLGRDTAEHLPAHVRAFADGLVEAGRLDARDARGWPGHAYLLASTTRRRLAGAEVLLTGDAAGLAAPGSGEGIYAAVRSGQLCAEAIRGLTLDNDRLALVRYDAALARELGRGRHHPSGPPRHPAPWRAALVRAAFRSRAFARHVVLAGTFLHHRSPQPATTA